MEKSNETLQSMKVMHLFFQSGYHNVLREIEKRVKSEKKESNSTTNDQVDIQKMNDYLLK